MIATEQVSGAPSFRSKSTLLRNGRVRAAVRRCWPWLRLLVAVGILAALAWRLGAGAFVAGLRVITVSSLLAAVGIGFLTTLFGAWRWCLVARNLGLPLKLGTAVADCYRSVLLNSVLPAGVLGDVHRAVDHGHRSGDLGRGVRAVVLERFAGQLALAVAGLGALMAYPALVTGVLPGRGLVVVVAVLLLAVVALLLARASAAGRRVWATALRDARRGLFARRAWPGVALLSAATVVGNVALFVVAARVAGVTAPVAQLFPIMILTLMVMGLPLNVGGWGPREGFSAFAFGAVGLGATAGLTTAVVYGVLSLAACAPGVLVLFRRRPGQGSPGSRAVRYPAKDSTRLASSALPLAADASDGRPITPEVVYAATPSVSR